MKTRTKKIILLACSTTLAVTTFGYILLNSDNLNFMKKVNSEEHSNTCLFNHYDAVEPTEDCHGSKEFWACCSHMTFVLDEPEFGTIHEAGPFSGNYFDELDENDDRYIPALPKTRTIKFYCDDLLLDTQFVRDGNKLESVASDDFIISGWYTEKELINSWDFANDVVDGNINLYSDYIAKNKSFSVDASDALEVDSYGFSATTELEREVCVSKGVTPVDSFAVLENRGILFNKSEIGVISELTIDIDSADFESAKIYYGSTPLSFDSSQDLSSGTNVIDLFGAEYFTIQNIGEENIKINSVNIQYIRKTIYNNTDIPTVVINTKNSQAVTSRTTYVDCNVSTIGADKDVSDLKAQIKVRGNSTSTLPKKPYRIKLDKKNSLFGYTKAKNWVLLADYMDGSNMHNYTALSFAKMVRGDDSFAATPLHVNVLMNGENIGLYLFCEHIDAKEGRLNIEQDNVWEKEFDQINFYVERDKKTKFDPTEIENETFFDINLSDYAVSEYTFALKYPQKEDFEEELENGEIDKHESEFTVFFTSLKNYFNSVCNLFVNYYNDSSKFSDLSSLIDVDSLVEYAITDQFFCEGDHGLFSFKMYRVNGEKLKFGPNWDYDSAAYALPYQGTYILSPFEVGSKTFQNLWIGETWSYSLFKDISRGRPLFKIRWCDISAEDLSLFLKKQLIELNTISYHSIYDCEKWMSNQFYSMFDNLQYYWQYINTQSNYLLTFYSA